MFLQCQLYTLYILHFHFLGIVSAITSIGFSPTNDCKEISYTVWTETNAFSGQCGVVNETNGINSFSPSTIDQGCTVTGYTDHACTDNAVSRTPGACQKLKLGSFSVDCAAVNGTLEGNYTTKSGALSSTPVPSDLLSEQRSRTTTQPFSPTGAFTPTQISTSKTPNVSTTFSTAVSPFTSPVSSPTSLQATSSPRHSSLPPSPTPSQPAEKNGGDGDELKSYQIALIGVIPVVFIIIAFSIWWRKRKKKEEEQPRAPALGVSTQAIAERSTVDTRGSGRIIIADSSETGTTTRSVPSAFLSSSRLPPPDLVE